jgi:hypothetical protein
MNARLGRFAAPPGVESYRRPVTWVRHAREARPTHLSPILCANLGRMERSRHGPVTRGG